MSEVLVQILPPLMDAASYVILPTLSSLKQDPITITFSTPLSWTLYCPVLPCPVLDWTAPWCRWRRQRLRRRRSTRLAKGTARWPTEERSCTSASEISTSSTPCTSTPCSGSPTFSCRYGRDNRQASLRFKVVALFRCRLQTCSSETVQ